MTIRTPLHPTELIEQAIDARIDALRDAMADVFWKEFAALRNEVQEALDRRALKAEVEEFKMRMAKLEVQLKAMHGPQQ